MQIRLLETRDISSLVRAWNASLLFDPITEAHFRRVVLADPNYEPEGAFVAVRGEEIVGFSHAVVRRGVRGKDGRGLEPEAGSGHLKAFFTADTGCAAEAGAALLEQAERFCALAGKHELCVTAYSGPYFWPGVDDRYRELREALSSRGYRDDRTIADVGVDLERAEFADALERVRTSTPPGVSVSPWDPPLLPAMKAFVDEAGAHQWFPPGWEERLAARSDNVFLLLNDGEVLGWAKLSRGDSPWFGPMLVLPRARGNHYGARLLLECMARAREAGARDMTAGWANVEFYRRYGWSVVRSYTVMTKRLA